MVSNEDGEYCKACMQIHLVEKMFVNLTAMQRPNFPTTAESRTSPYQKRGQGKTVTCAGLPPLDVTRQPNNALKKIS